MVKDCFPNILNVLFVPIVHLYFIVNPISDQRDLPNMSVMGGNESSQATHRQTGSHYGINPYYFGGSEKPTDFPGKILTTTR